VLVFWSWQKIVIDFTYVFSIQYSCGVVSVIWLWQEIVLKMRTRFYKKILSSIKTNTYPLHLRSIHTILCKIGHVIQIVPETPISVSGHETRSTAIPKLGETWISVSGHETRSNCWNFPFPPFAEGVCCERLLYVIIIPTDGHTVYVFFFRS
jgi:hypothetical protein